MLLMQVLMQVVGEKKDVDEAVLLFQLIAIFF